MALQYKQAAKVIDNVLKKKASIKTSIYQNNEIKNKKIILAIVSKTLANMETIEKLLCDIKDFRTIKQKTMLMVMLNDYITNGKISGGGAIKSVILKNKEKIPILEKKQKEQETFKYYRLNTLRTKVFPSISNKVEPDKFIPNLYKLTPPLSLPIDTLLSQDKPSCFPAFILNPPENSICIDACAAPGNKTTHLATIMNNTGIIYAFDKDIKRAELLRTTVKNYQATNIEVICGDFLQSDIEDIRFENVTHILCDPSCSGSGILERQLTKEKRDPARLRMLSSFQTKIVSHAMKFKNVQRITYSTCSVNNEENECVVKAVLDENPSFRLEPAFPQWQRRGIAIDDSYPYENCIRVDPHEDHMTGFFVALFVRK
ncbi:hypothetical protein ENUP19_0082G0042 [Entamoeba nuttalli]|uniref:Methyltransferase, putative n=2 Tax=Entamoeba nuttalli TaxID=412467 RepID=K2G8E6_ENTNP|nr:methyltransferase, putative [Entamoeba nuttalli P19]EKE38676.1 methyltransferase, putative [Entamoeba nuttalli P19]|eukprot:XP_008858990.1 methyltransferase, putative [Entamoeba nuttalli P19]